MKKREIWSIKEFKTFNIDLGQRSRYGFYPSDVNMYLENIKVKNVYFNSSKEHLKNILQEIVPSEMNWNSEGDILKNEIKNWWNKNKDKIVWNSKKYRYEWWNNKE